MPLITKTERVFECPECGDDESLVFIVRGRMRLPISRDLEVFDHEYDGGDYEPVEAYCNNRSCTWHVIKNRDTEVWKKEIVPLWKAIDG